MYCGITQVPECFSPENGSMLEGFGHVALAPILAAEAVGHLPHPVVGLDGPEAQFAHEAAVLLPLDAPEVEVNQWPQMVKKVLLTVSN